MSYIQAGYPSHEMFNWGYLVLSVYAEASKRPNPWDKCVTCRPVARRRQRRQSPPLILGQINLFFGKKLVINLSLKDFFVNITFDLGVALG